MKQKVLYGDLTSFPLINKKALIITSNYFVNINNEPLKQIKSKVKNSIQYYKVSTNPTLNMVTEAISLYKQNNCEIIIAIGGGSVIDVAKSVAIFNSIETNQIWNYFLKIKDIDNISSNTQLIVIPTTYGTGSEYNNYAVITNKNEKRSISSKKLKPDMIFNDFNLLGTLPKRQLALNCFDCLMHAVECYVSNKSTKKSKEISLKCIDKILEIIPEINNPKIDSLCEASKLSGEVENISSCISLHSLGHAISSFNNNILHGESILLIAQAYFKVISELDKTIVKPIDELISNKTLLSGVVELCNYFENYIFSMDKKRTNYLIKSFYDLKTTQILKKAKELSRNNNMFFCNDRMNLTDAQLLECLKLDFIDINKTILNYVSKSDIIFINSNCGIGSHDTDIYCVTKGKNSETHCFYDENGKWIEIFIDSWENLIYKINTVDALGINYASMLDYYDGDRKKYEQIQNKCLEKKQKYYMYKLDELLLTYRVQISYEKISPNNHPYTNITLLSALIYPFVSLLMGKYHVFPSSPRNWLTQLEAAMGDDFRDLDCLFDGKYDYEKIGALIKKNTKKLDPIDIEFIGKNRRSRVE